MNEGQAHQTHDVAEARDPQDVAIDPVCGMEVDKATARHRYERGSQPYFFCGARCREKFVAAPESYLAKREAPPPPISKSTIFTCPMHPEIRQEGPGNCPICGMALEPLDGDRRGRTERRALDMSRRFWIGLVAVPAGRGAGDGRAHPSARSARPGVAAPVSIWLQFVFATPVVLWAGWPFFERALGLRRASQPEHVQPDRARDRRGLSLQRGRNVLAPAPSPLASAAWTASVAVYFEAAAVITVLVLLGQVLELRAREQTGGAIRALLNLAPKTARRLRMHGDDEEIPARRSAGR